MHNRADAPSSAIALPQPREPRRASLLEVIALAGFAAFGAFALLPSQTEKVAALIAEERFEEAIGLLEAEANEAPLSDYETFSLATLYYQAEDTERAAELLEEMMARLPDSLPVLHELADIYRTSARPQDELRVLLKLHTLSPTPEIEDQLTRLLGPDSGEAWRERAALFRNGEHGRPLASIKGS